MKMNNRVVVDIDGVLANFEKAFCQEFGWERREMVSLESRYPAQSRAISQFVEDLFSYQDLELLPLGLEIINYLNRYRFEVHLVSARPWGSEKPTQNWLKRHGVNFDSLYVSRQKTGQIANLRPLCAVDDLFSVQQTLLKHNIPTLLIAQPWNNYSDENIQRITNIHEFMESLDCIIQGF
jgi:hypothetical protein